jgi:hypothetical protein
MFWRTAADALVLLHGLFIAWVVLGGLAVLRWPALAWLHLPCAAWGVWIEWSGGICPLTPLEWRWRELAGEQGYAGGFVEHYLLPLIYPAGLTRDVQFVLGGFVGVLNAIVYTIVVRRAALRRSPH